MENGSVKTYANKTQAENKVEELTHLGFQVHRSFSYPFLILNAAK